MKDPSKVHKHFGIVLGCSLVLSGICLIIGCLQIYRSGPFSPEAVKEAFQSFCIPIYLSLMLLLIGFLLDLCLPKKSDKLPPVRLCSAQLKRAREKADLSRCNEALARQIALQQRSRKTHGLIAVVILTVGSVIFFIYALQSSTFHPTEINASVIRATYVLLACMVVPFSYGVYCAYSCRYSIMKEIELLKLAPVAVEKVQKTTKTNNTATTFLLRAVLVILGICILIYGFFSGGTADVLTKAINICTECVGLG